MVLLLHRCFKRAAVTAALALTAAVPSAAGAQVQPGDQSQWSLDFRVRLEQPAGPPVEMHMTGDWISTVVATRPGAFDVQLQVAGIHFAGDAVGGVSAASMDDLRSRLSRAFWATYRDDGRLLRIHFLRDVSPSDQNLLQMVASETQLVKPSAARPQWTTQERDGAGEYAALYLETQPGHIIKRKLKYVYTDGVAGAAANSIHVSLDRSAVDFSLRSDGGVASVDGSSRMLIVLSPEQKQPLVVATEIHLSNLRRARAPELVGSLARALPNVLSSPIVSHNPDAAEVRARADNALLKGKTTESLLAGAFAGNGSSADLGSDLVALFRSRPDAAAAAASLLRKDGPQRRVTDALGAAASPAATAALANLAGDASLSPRLREDAIMGFIQMQHPSAKAMQAPAALMRDLDFQVRSAARMISAALARAGRPEHPQDANAIDRSLVGLYRAAHDTDEAKDLLGALGNSVGPEVIPVISEAVHDQRGPIRAAAARALRLAPGSDVDEILAGVIASDPDAAVRSDAIFAARFRRPLPATLADAVMRAAASDAVEYVRSNAIALLRQSPAASPDISRTLTEIAKSDSSAGIRRQASDALASMQLLSQRTVEPR